MLTVGIPKEIKSQEKRVGLIPEGVERLHAEGVRVLIEKGAGEASGFADEVYRQAGAEIAADAKILYTRAGLIQKVKEPLPEEYALLKKGQILFCFLHLASPVQCELVRVLTGKRVTALAFETLERDGILPLLAPMSRLAGALAVLYAACIRRVDLVDAGQIRYPDGFLAELEQGAANYPNVPAGQALGKSVLFGGGQVGEEALKTALKIRGTMVLVEKNLARRKALEKLYGDGKGCVRYAAPEALEEEVLEQADVLIGCVHHRGGRALRVLTAEQLERVSRNKKKILMDVAIDQGGNFPESRPTTYADPLYLDAFGNLRFGVANMPSYCGRAASQALTRETLPYTLALAKDPEAALKDLPELASAVNIREGQILLQAVREAHQR